MYAQMMVVEAIQYTAYSHTQIFIACTMNSCVQFSTPTLSTIRTVAHKQQAFCVHVTIPLGTPGVKMVPHHMQIL